MTDEERTKLIIYCFQRRLAAAQTFGDELVEKIKSAFSGNEYPGDDDLVASPEHLARCEECRGYDEFFVGKTWKDCLDEAAFGRLTGGQSFFRPRAWHYYLPAYLIQCVSHCRFSSSNFRAPSESELEDEDYWNEFKQKRIDLLSSEQCRVIVDYLEIALKVWQGIEKSYEDDLKPLHFWRENYRKALAREKNLNR